MQRFVWLLLFFASFAPAQSIQDFFRQSFAERLKDEPEFATGVGHHEYDDRWNDWSKAGRDLRLAHRKQQQERLNSFSLASLSPQDRLSARLMQFNLKTDIDSYDLEDELLRVSQQNGLHNRVYTVFDRMPALTVHDYENMIARLRAIPVYIDQNIAVLDDAVARGLTQPKVVVDLVSAQIAAQIAQDKDHTALLAAFNRFPTGIPEAERNRLRTAGIAAYEQQFLPAWRKYHDYITGRYAGAARPSIAISSIPHGREDYAILVHRYTTTNLAADDIHKLGLSEVDRIENEMKALLKETGFNGSIADYERKLEATPEQHFHDREEMLAYCRNVAKMIEPELPHQFRHIPELLYGIRAIPADREAATATNAQAPSPDYTTPGWMNLNAYQPEKQTKYNKESLVLHEAVPGHVFQITLAQALPGIPDFRRFYGNSAYVEGWALYAESLGAQVGVYKDPASRFGQLASERFRGVRLVVDTGMHTKGWSREQAIEYFKQHAPDESLAEVDRYIAWPSQALSYKMGQLKIRELRTEAEKQLGSKFDIREFHDLILRNGVLPLELLQQQVEEDLRAGR